MRQVRIPTTPKSVSLAPCDCSLLHVPVLTLTGWGAALAREESGSSRVHIRHQAPPLADCASSPSKPVARSRLAVFPVAALICLSSSSEASIMVYL